MPTYEYECTACGQHIEVFQRITEDPLTTCGGCGGPLRKVFHPAGIVFKGSGFYATDSRSGARAGAGSGAKEPKKGDGGSDTSGGAKESSSGAKESSSGGSTGSKESGSSASRERSSS